VVALLAPTAAIAYPWPVKPFDRQHPIRGNFGDPRILRGGIDLSWDNVLHFHSGVDVQAPDGTPVYAIEAGEAVAGPRMVAVGTPWASPSAPVVFGYWHLDPVVGRYQYVARGQLIGYIHPGAGHVHLSERRYGTYVNPLRPGGLAPYVDHTPPVVRRLVIYRSGTRTEVSPDAVTGAVDFAVDAYDVPPMALRQPWTKSIVSPARITWGGLFAGQWLPLAYRPQLVDFTRLPGLALRDVYAHGTWQNEAHVPGVYRFWLARHVSSDLLGDGPHRVRVTAADIRGNARTRTFTFTVGKPAPAGQDNG
jgi:hypothetical protein